MDKNNTLFKDKEEFRTNKDGYYKWYKRLADLLKSCEKMEDYKKIFWNEDMVKGTKTNPNHTQCSFDLENDIKKIDEPRMCRCMYYYDEKNPKCMKCPLEKKYKNISKYKIIEHEIPMHHQYKKCGGIDLVITDDNNVNYYVEMKDKDSKETIIRMVSEIYTYTLDDEERFKHKAIGFFAGSKQFNEYITEHNSDNHDFDYILKDITVFIFYEKSIDESGVVTYEIEKE